eukprot:1492243-Lingulodinium_polyedra.AAC.1
MVFGVWRWAVARLEAAGRVLEVSPHRPRCSWSRAAAEFARADRYSRALAAPGGSLSSVLELRCEDAGIVRGARAN